MTDKVLVDVFLPAANRSFDVYIPSKMKVHEATRLLSGIVSDLSSGYFIADENTELCDRRSGDSLDVNRSIEELKIHNGSKLILI